MDPCIENNIVVSGEKSKQSEKVQFLADESECLDASEISELLNKYTEHEVPSLTFDSVTSGVSKSGLDLGRERQESREGDILSCRENEKDSMEDEKDKRKGDTQDSREAENDSRISDIQNTQDRIEKEGQDWTKEEKDSRKRDIQHTQDTQERRKANKDRKEGEKDRVKRDTQDIRHRQDMQDIQDVHVKEDLQNRQDTQYIQDKVDVLTQISLKYEIETPPKHSHHQTQDVVSDSQPERGTHYQQFSQAELGSSEKDSNEGSLRYEHGDILKENEVKTQRSNITDSRHHQTKKNSRKSASPYHVGNNRRLAKWAQWLGHKESKHSNVEDADDESLGQDMEIVINSPGKVVREDEGLLKFAEILYKCSLCTALPCILTSRSAFLRHVQDQHLTNRDMRNQCPCCQLYFQTFSDLQTHITETHVQPVEEMDSSERHSCGHSDQHVTDTQHENPHHTMSNDNRKETRDNIDDENDKNQSQEQKVKEEKKDTAEVIVKSEMPPRQPSSTPQATVEYRSSPQNLHSHQTLSMSPASASSPQHIDPSRSSLFGGVPEPLNGFPSYTPEFGRYTKLVREGGRIVYFCQVCNIKCQVKAAFHVHCNGVRHHNTVNMAGKNKSRVNSPVSQRDITARDLTLRTPLKEVSVVGSQFVPHKGENSFLEKMTRFYQDHPNVSTLCHGKMSDLWTAPLNFSLKDHSGKECDSSKQSLHDELVPDKDALCQGRFHESDRYESSQCHQDCDNHCTEQTELKTKCERDDFDLKTKDQDQSHTQTESKNTETESRCAIHNRKRPLQSSTTSPSLSEVVSVPLTTTTSPTLMVKSTASDTCEKTTNDNGSVNNHDGHSRPKRQRVETSENCEVAPKSDTQMAGIYSADMYHSQPSTPQALSYQNQPQNQPQTEYLHQPHTNNKNCPDSEKRKTDKSTNLNSSTNTADSETRKRRRTSTCKSNFEAKQLVNDFTDIHQQCEDDSFGYTTSRTESSQGPLNHKAKSPRSALTKIDSSLVLQQGKVEPPRTSVTRIDSSYATQQSTAESSTSAITKLDSPQGTEHNTAESSMSVVTKPDSSPGTQHNTTESSTSAVTKPGSSQGCPTGLDVSPDPKHPTNTFSITAVKEPNSPQPQDTRFLDMLSSHRFSVEPAENLFPGGVPDSWSQQEGPRDTEPALWGPCMSLRDPDDVTEGVRGQNSEGWKVTQIRDVLKGLISASSKSSSVARDTLLYRVSVELRSADVQHWGPACNRAVRDLFPHCLAQRKGKFKKTYFFGLSLIPGPEESKRDNEVHVDGTSFRPLRDMTQDLEQLLEHLPGLLYWSGEVSRGVSRDAVLHVLAARLSESEVFHWGMQCNKALRMLFPLVLMKRKGKYKTTIYFGVDFTPAAHKLLPKLDSLDQIPWQEQRSNATY